MQHHMTETSHFVEFKCKFEILSTCNLRRQKIATSCPATF